MTEVCDGQHRSMYIGCSRDISSLTGPEQAVTNEDVVGY